MPPLLLYMFTSPNFLIIDGIRGDGLTDDGDGLTDGDGFSSDDGDGDGYGLGDGFIGV